MKKLLGIISKISPFLLALLPAVALATTPYVPLEPLPFVSASNGTNLPALLQGLFQLLIIGGAGIATLMITIGGIQYMTGDALHQKAEGRARIQNAAFGLIFLLFIYLLLRTINPQLLNFDLSHITQVGGQSGKVVAADKQQAAGASGAASAGPAASTPSSGGTPNGSSPASGGGSGTGGGASSGGGGSTALPGDYGDGSGFAGPSPSPAAPGPTYTFTQTTAAGETIPSYSSSFDTCAAAQRGIPSGSTVTSQCTAMNL